MSISRCLSAPRFHVTIGCRRSRLMSLKWFRSTADISFFVVRDEIVIVEPSTYKIVTVLPRSGGTTAARRQQAQAGKVTFTDLDRDVVRKHTRVSTERRTTGSAASARVEIRRGERVPDTVEIEEFPETVYREAPSLRDYRYIHRENRTYLVEATERRVIEEID